MLVPGAGTGGGAHTLHCQSDPSICTYYGRRALLRIRAHSMELRRHRCVAQLHTLSSQTRYLWQGCCLLGLSRTPSPSLRNRISLPNVESPHNTQADQTKRRSAVAKSHHTPHTHTSQIKRHRLVKKAALTSMHACHPPCDQSTEMILSVLLGWLLNDHLM